MKRLLTFAAVALSLSAPAQITLEHTYSDIQAFSVFNIENDGQKYVMYDTMGKVVRLYNDNHSLWKTVSINLPVNSFPVSISAVSRNLFDSDNQIEFAIACYDIVATAYTTYCYDETGSSFFSVPGAAGLHPIEVNGKWKLLAYLNYKNALYAVPGQYVGLGIKPIDDRTDEVASMIYPNPVDQTATIQYSLPTGVNQAELGVYNSSGVKIRSHQVTNQFNNILIDLDELSPGTYFYRLNAAGVEPDGKMFVVQ